MDVPSAFIVDGDGVQWVPTIRVAEMAFKTYKSHWKTVKSCATSIIQYTNTNAIPTRRATNTELDRLVNIGAIKRKWNGCRLIRVQNINTIIEDIVRGGGKRVRAVNKTSPQPSKRPRCETSPLAARTDGDDDGTSNDSDTTNSHDEFEHTTPRRRSPPSSAPVHATPCPVIAPASQPIRSPAPPPVVVTSVAAVGRPHITSAIAARVHATTNRRRDNDAAQHTVRTPSTQLAPLRDSLPRVPSPPSQQQPTVSIPLRSLHGGSARVAFVEDVRASMRRHPLYTLCYAVLRGTDAELARECVRHRATLKTTLHRMDGYKHVQWASDGRTNTTSDVVTQVAKFLLDSE